MTSALKDDSIFGRGHCFFGLMVSFKRRIVDSNLLVYIVQRVFQHKLDNNKL
jgi:hypothetical protein